MLLLQAFIRDYTRYRKASLCLDESFRQDKMNARMMPIGHSLEKGMTFESPKNNWGKEKAIQLCDMISAYMQDYPISEEVTSCLNILKAYRSDDDSCKTLDATGKIDGLIELHQQYLENGYAGVKEVKEPDTFDTDSILAFFQSRASVRFFQTNL